MPNVKLEALQEGMVVTTDVRNLDNMLLIPAGCALSDRHINILCAWGIAEIQVEACEDSEDAKDLLQQLPPGRLDQLTRELAATFWEPVDKGPVQQEVFNLVLRRQAKRALGK
ncbi:MAG: hypothetical protein ABSF95_21735 [Verrucomicrobiota bacterium]|jgi:hypothetical protein